MKLNSTMLVVADINKSVDFYKKVLGLHVIMDFGANKTLTGGLALQTVETYKEFIGTNEICFGGNNFEIYFEEDDFDEFADKLNSGLTPEQVAERMDVPMKFVNACMQ